MGQDITIRGTTYTGAEKVKIPLADESGDAYFIDPSGATLSSGGEMLNGVKSFDANGDLVTGSIQTKTGSDLSASGDTVIVPAGHYASQVSKAVSGGTVTAPASISGTGATISTSAGKIILTKSVSVTPNVTTAGYISAGTAGNASVSLDASATIAGATTYHPSTSDQTIASGTYTTAAQTIKAVTTSGLSAGNIVAGVTIKVGDSSDDDCVASVTGTAQIPAISYDSGTHVLSIS